MRYFSGRNAEGFLIGKALICSDECGEEIEKELASMGATSFYFSPALVEYLEDIAVCSHCQKLAGGKRRVRWSLDLDSSSGFFYEKLD